MSTYLEIFDFNTLQFVLYVALWAVIGGLPGFYMFFARNHNPRVGARLGIITGVGLGVLFAGMESIDPKEIFYNSMFLWLWALLMTFFIPRGNHIESSTMRQRIADLAYGLLLPTFILVMGIVIVPMLWNVLFAFRPVSMRRLQTIQLISLEELNTENFTRVFESRNNLFWFQLRITLFYTFMGSILAIFMGLVAALIVKERFPGRGAFRGILLFPYIAPIAAVTIVWKRLLSANNGLVNEIMDNYLGWQRIDFLTTQDYALGSAIIFQGWRYFPFAYLFILARIQAIPTDMYEAAKVDGASPSQRLMYITLPQLRAVFGTLFLLRFIWTFNKFEDIFLLNGGITRDTQVLPVLIYTWLFSRNNVGAASAVALVMAAVLFLLVGIYFMFFLKEEEA